MMRDFSQFVYYESNPDGRKKKFGERKGRATSIHDDWKSPKLIYTLLLLLLIYYVIKFVH